VPPDRLDPQDPQDLEETRESKGHRVPQGLTGDQGHLVPLDQQELQVTREPQGPQDRQVPPATEEIEAHLALQAHRDPQVQ